MLRTKIRNNLIQRVFAPITAFLARLGWAGLTGLLLRLLVKCVQKQPEGSTSESIHALILPKAGFTEDVMACFGGKSEYSIFTLDRSLIKAVFKGFLPIEIDDNNYLSTDPDIEKKKKELRIFWKRALGVLIKSIPVDVVLTGSFTYASEQELAGALNEISIPFVAMHKECLKTPGLEPFYLEIYKTLKNQFQGAKICVYNEVESRIQKAAGISEPENIVVTGIPRLDPVHRYREQLSVPDELLKKKPTVLFFSFNTKAGLPILGRKLPQRFGKLEENLERLNCEKLSESCHIAMLKLARENPGIRVVIKTKGDVQSDIILRKFFNGNFNFPANLEIMAGGDPLRVLTESSVVCSYNSTTLLEAIALNIPVIIPKFFEALNPEISPYILDLEDAAEYADSQERLIEMLKETAAGEQGINRPSELDAMRHGLLEKWAGNPDGRSGQRVRHVVGAVVSEYRGMRVEV